jgi:hypothetical protein
LSIGTGQRAADEDPVADVNSLDPLPDLHDRAGGIQPERKGERFGGMIDARTEIGIDRVNAGGFDLDEYLAWPCKKVGHRFEPHHIGWAVFMYTN